MPPVFRFESVGFDHKEIEYLQEDIIGENVDCHLAYMIIGLISPISCRCWQEYGVFGDRGCKRRSSISSCSFVPTPGTYNGEPRVGHAGDSETWRRGRFQARLFEISISYWSMLEFLIDIPLRAQGGDLEQGQRIVLNLVSPGEAAISKLVEIFFADFPGRPERIQFLRVIMPYKVTPNFLSAAAIPVGISVIYILPAIQCVLLEE
jgi:hypothetical protein